MDKKIHDFEFSTCVLYFWKFHDYKSLRLGKKDMLSPQFIEPYEILERVGAVAYRLTTTKLVSYSFGIPCFDVTKVYARSILCIISLAIWIELWYHDLWGVTRSYNGVTRKET